MKIKEIKYGYGIVEYDITLQEMIEYAVAIIFVLIVSIIKSSCIADFMSLELEELFCGFIPERHKIIYRMTDREIDNFVSIQNFLK